MTDTLGPAAFGATNPATTRPAFTPGNAPGDPKTWAKNCSSPSANDGTEVDAAWGNALLAQLRNAIEKGGAPENNLDDDMLAKAMQIGKVGFAANTGSVNAIAVALSPAPTAYYDGMPVRFYVAGDNTSASVTLNVNGLGAVPILTTNGQNVGIGAFAPGAYQVIYFGGNFYLVSPPAYLNRIGGATVYATPGSFTFTVPAGVRRLRRVRGVGGGGSGGGSNGATAGASGAGAGGWFEAFDVPVTPLQTIAVVVGAGSTTVAGNSDGTSGGTTSVAGVGSATGGGGGKINGGLGGSSGSGSLSGGIQGDAGPGGGGFTVAATGSGVGGQGGGTLYGTGGIPSGGVGGQGSTPGSGGAGGYNNDAGGNGANGRVIIEY